MFRSGPQRGAVAGDESQCGRVGRSLAPEGRISDTLAQGWNWTPSIISPRLLLMTSAYHGVIGEWVDEWQIFCGVVGENRSSEPG